MGSFLSVFGYGLGVILAAGTLFSLQRTWRASRSLRNRCVSELKQLKTQLAGRHLIVSHLLDAVPPSFEQHFACDQLCDANAKAEQILQQVDAESPDPRVIRELALVEQELFELLEELTHYITAEDLDRDSAISGCVHGLIHAEREINNGVTTYNASVITYGDHLEAPVASFLARGYLRGDFTLVELNPLSSDRSAPDN